MLLIIVGILLILLGSLRQAGFHKSSYLQDLVWLLGLFLVIFGLFVPISGYEEPKFIEEQNLYQINMPDEFEESSQETYLVIDLENSTGVSYTFCIENDGFLNTITKYSSITGLGDVH